MKLPSKNVDKINNWNRIKKEGIVLFILKIGVMRWGIPTGLIYGLLVNLKFLKTHQYREFFTAYLIDLSVFTVLGGFLFGFCMWHIVNFRSKKL